MRFKSELMGLVLFDSIVFLRAKNEDKKVNCLQRIVDQIYHVTGVAVCAAALGGASFSGHVTYEQMLKYAVEQSGEVMYKFVFVISMGNDIYVKGPDFAKNPYELADRAESAATSAVAAAAATAAATAAAATITNVIRNQGPLSLQPMFQPLQMMPPRLKCHC